MLIISGGGILPVPARTNHNRKNPATGYDHRITASIFLPFPEFSCQKSTESGTGIISLGQIDAHD
jgi:hypothetical protein